MLLCPSARAVEVQARQVPPGTGWMALHGGGSASFWDNYAANFPNNFVGGFTAFGEVAAPAVRALMRGVKDVFDPNRILNPGRVID